MTVSQHDHSMLPVEIVLHPSWWHAHVGISFDEDFFYHPAKRVPFSNIQYHETQPPKC